MDTARRHRRKRVTRQLRFNVTIISTSIISSSNVSVYSAKCTALSTEILSFTWQALNYNQVVDSKVNKARCWAQQVASDQGGFLDHTPIHKASWQQKVIRHTDVTKPRNLSPGFGSTSLTCSADITLQARVN